MIDLPDRKVPTSEGIALAMELGLSYIETTAKQSSSVDALYRLLLWEFVRTLALSIFTTKPFFPLFVILLRLAAEKI